MNVALGHSTGVTKPESYKPPAVLLQARLRKNIHSTLKFAF